MINQTCRKWLRINPIYYRGEVNIQKDHIEAQKGYAGTFWEIDWQEHQNLLIKYDKLSHGKLYMIPNDYLSTVNKEFDNILGL